MKLLIFNVGSETLKYAAYEDKNFLEKKSFYTREYDAIVRSILEKFEPQCIVHRVVHGGPLKNCFVTAGVIRTIKRYGRFAPLHNPSQLQVIQLCKKYSSAGQVKQVAIFDTSFFSELPEKARTYALPLALIKKYNIKRYGFHGMNHEHIARQFPDKNIVSCHLGAGCSVAAIAKGRAMDISMGMTPLEGVVMVTRSGSIDPGVVLWLVELLGLKKAEEVLNHESGLYGLAGSKDVRKLVDERDKPKNALALDVFCYSIAKQVCSYLAALGSIDVVAFSGGIGEASEWVRNKICSCLPFNFKTAVVKADEEAIMLERARELLKS